MISSSRISLRGSVLHDRRQLLLAEDFWIFLATTCQTTVDVRFLFRRSLRLELTSWAYPAININRPSCLQALTKDISTPADIAPSALETRIFYCFMASTTCCINTASCTTGWVNYTNKPSQAALERSSQDAYKKMASLGWRATRRLCGQ